MRQLLAIVCMFLLVSPASANTFFISTSGADTNNGTAKGTPWLHAPGMPNCSNTCAAYVCAAGDQFIFKGGETWHFGDSGATPYVGGAWSWTCSGSATSCDYDNSLTSTCTYIGVDKTWFTGGAWARPKFNFDNPLSTSLVASCAFDQSNVTPGLEISASRVLVDNFEWFGHCHSGVNPRDAYTGRAGTFVAFINNYFHGLTMTNNGQPNGNTPMDQASIIGGGTINSGNAVTNNVVAFNVFDDSDGFCTGVGTCSGGPISLTDSYSFHDNVVRFLANGNNNPCNSFLHYNNFYEQMYESFDAADHGSIDVTFGSCLPAGTTVWLFNNIVRNTNIGVTFQRGTTDNGAFEMFGNVMFGIGNSGNCVQLSNQVTADASQFNFYNNTFDSPCTIRGAAGNPNPANGTANFQNNHFIGFSPNVPPYTNTGGSTITVNEIGNDVYQTEGVANGQGYTTSNNYQPTLVTNATVGAGANLTTRCNGLSATAAVTACKLSNTAVTYDSVNHIAVPTAGTARPSGGAWDSGAWIFATSTPATPPYAGCGACFTLLDLLQ